MPQNTLLELINANLSTPLAFLFFYLLVDNWRFSLKKMRLLFVLFPLCLMAIQATIFFAIDDFLLKRIILTMSAAFFGLGFCLSTTNYRLGQVLFIGLTDFSLLLVGGIFAECIGSTSSLQRLVIKVVINVLISLFIIFLFRPSLSRLLREADLSWYKLAFIPLAFSLLLLFLLIPGRLYEERDLQIVAIALALALCLCYTAIYHIFRTLKDGFDLKADNELLRAQMTSLENQTTLLQGAYDQVRIFRHDMRHYMQIQSACLDVGDLDGAFQLLSTMQENLDNGLRDWKLRAYTDQPLVDAVLSSYATRAEQSNISFSISLTLPDPLPALSGDLAVMLSNALENALNACLRLPAHYKGSIALQGIQAQQQFLLVVSNPFVGDVKLDPITRLPVTQEAGHGFGTQSIAAFAKRYDATLDYAIKDGQFSLRLLFPPK